MVLTQLLSQLHHYLEDNFEDQHIQRVTVTRRFRTKTRTIKSDDRKKSGEPLRRLSAFFFLGGGRLNKKSQHFREEQHLHWQLGSGTCHLTHVETLGCLTLDSCEPIIRSCRIYMTPGFQWSRGESDGQIFLGLLRVGDFPLHLANSLAESVRNFWSARSRRTFWHSWLQKIPETRKYITSVAMQGGKLEERWLLPPKAVKNVPDWKLDFKKVVSVWEMMSESRGEGWKLNCKT